MRKTTIIVAILLAACSPEDDPKPILEPIEVGSVRWADRNIERLYVFGDDPCPVGWRVPTAGELNTLVDEEHVAHEASEQGVRFTDNASGNSIALPLAGYRLAGSEKVSGEGSYGCYWSSTAGGEEMGLCLTMFVSPKGGKITLFPNDPAEVGVAQSVRCVME